MTRPQIVDPFADLDEQRAALDRHEQAMYSRIVALGIDPRHAPTVASALARHLATLGTSYNRTDPRDDRVGRFCKQHLAAHPDHAAPARPQPSIRGAGYDAD
jgi:hypothetical protein